MAKLHPLTTLFMLSGEVYYIVKANIIKCLSHFVPLGFTVTRVAVSGSNC